jgi:hypothetical protein
MALSLMEALVSLSITVMLSTLSIRQARFYYMLLQRYLRRFALPATSPLRRQQIGTATPFHHVIHGSYSSEAVRELTNTLIDPKTVISHSDADQKTFAVSNEQQRQQEKEEFESLVNREFAGKELLPV